MRILLVEDEKKVSELVARALRAERFAVDLADDGLQGWELEETAARYEVLSRAAELNYQTGATADAAAQAPGG
jgi:DNA-binding response OmpR family regulator